MDDIVIAIRTCKRLDVIEQQTLNVVKDLPFKIYIFCPESEKKEYLKKYKGVYTITRGSDEGLNVANEMIYNYFPKNKKIVVCDDDVKGFWEMKDNVLVEGNLEKYIIEGFTQCEENGFKLFGFYPVKNAYFMKDRKELDLGLNYIQGGIFGVLNNRAVLVGGDDYREDYERSIKHYIDYGGNIRFNHAVVEHIMVNNKGGLNDTRTNEKMVKSTEYMLNTYGMYLREKKCKSKYREIQIINKPYNTAYHLEKQLNCITWSKNTDRPNVSGKDESKSTKQNPVGFPCYSYTFGYIRPRRAKLGTRELTRITHKYPIVYNLAKKYLQELMPDFPFSTITINKDITCLPHTDKYNQSDSVIVAFGDYTEGGNLYIKIDETEHKINVKNKPYIFNGRNLHWNDKANGSRYSLVYFNL